MILLVGICLIQNTTLGDMIIEEFEYVDHLGHQKRTIIIAIQNLHSSLVYSVKLYSIPHIAEKGM